MSTSSNNLRKHFETFLPELDPAEMESVWNAVEPHLPVRRKNRLFWLPMGAGLVAALLVITWLVPLEERSPETAVAVSSAQEKVALDPQPGGEKNKAHISQAPAGLLQQHEPATRAGEDPPVNAAGNILPANGDADAGGREAAAMAPVTVNASGKDPLNNAGREIFTGRHGTEAVTTENDSLWGPDFLDRLTLLLPGEEPELDGKITTIPRPQYWQSKISVIVFGGPQIRKTTYSSRNTGSAPGWNAGVSLRRDIGRRWLIQTTAMTFGQRGEYGESADYYQAIAPGMISTSTTSPYGPGPRYRIVTERNSVENRQGFALSAGIGRKLLAGKKAGVNLLLSFGMQQAYYRGFSERVYGTDTLSQQPALQPLPNSSASLAHVYAASGGTASKGEFYRHFIVLPQIDCYYRFNHRVALLSRLMISAPLRLTENKLTLNSDIISVDNKIEPVRSTAFSLNLGISFRL